MDPLASAGQASQVVVDYGALGAVMLGASVIVAGLMLAVVVLWRAREASEKAREQSEREHYAWAVDTVGKQSEREHRLAEALATHAAATTTVRDLLVRLLAERP